MGNHPNIGINIFPKQGSWLGKKVTVCFNYDTSYQIKGKIIRDDYEEPYKTIIQLEDGRVILSSECQYHVEED